MTGSKRILIVARIGFWVAVIVLLAGSVSWMTIMTGKSVSEPLAEPTQLEREWAARLERDVHMLAGEIGERNMGTPGSMDRTVEWLDQRLIESGLNPAHHEYTLIGSGHAGETAVNVIGEIPGTSRAEELVVVGAHYDSVPGSPGANDNASAVAVVLALADWFSERPQARTLRFVIFANEEPPFYLSADMGSHAYAADLRDTDEQVTAMMALDGLGFFSTESGSQQFPAPGLGLAYSNRAEFIAFVTRMRNRSVLTDALGAFRSKASIPSEGAALPSFLPGVGWSDHWSFWQHGYPAFLVTDTLPFRDPHYHSPADTPERLDYERMARVAVGLKAVVQELAGE